MPINSLSADGSFNMALPTISRPVIKLGSDLIYQSIPCLTILPGPPPGDSHVLSAREIGFSPKISLPRGFGVLN